MSYSSPLGNLYREERTSYDSHQRYSPYQHPVLPSPSGSNTSRSARRPSVTYNPQTYPKELTNLFGALKCMLCSVEASSPITVKMHYSGKQHAKKVKMFLAEWCRKTGNPMPKPPVDKTPTTLVAGVQDYCKECDVVLTSVNDSIMHYSGKNHQKNSKNPANAKIRRRGYETIDLTSRFGIGANFATFEEVTKQVDSSAQRTQGSTGQGYVCDICDVRAVSQDQLQAHLSGKKHKEKFRKLNADPAELSPKPARPYPCKLCNVSLETRFLLNLHNQGKRHAKTLEKLQVHTSIVADSCDLCNVVFTSVDQYQAHITGKKHEMRVRQVYRTMHIPEEKASIVCKNCPFVGSSDHQCDMSLTKIELDNLENKLVCYDCHNMVFESEELYNEHKNSQRHILCVLNKEEGDKMIEELKHFYCIVCKKQCMTNADYIDHLFGEDHLILSEEKQFLSSNTNLFHCTVCDVIYDQALKEEHSLDMKHLVRCVKKDLTKSLTDLANQNTNITHYHCKACGTYATDSYVKFSAHLLHDEHVYNMALQRRNKFLSKCINYTA